jgi:hypothetical protein
MSQPSTSPAARLAEELPPDACRRLLTRLEDLRSRGEGGTLAELKVDDQGKLYVEVREVYSWGRGLTEAT